MILTWLLTRILTRWTATPGPASERHVGPFTAPTPPPVPDWTTEPRSEPHRLKAVGTVLVAEAPPCCDRCGKPLRAESMAGGWCGEQCFLRWHQKQAVLPAQHNLPGSWVQTTAGDARKAS